MKTFLKWNIRTAGAFILLMIITLMLTGRVVRDREENSAFGNTVYNGRSQTITYLNEADFSIETPRRWLRFFQDTKKGYRNHFEKYDISFLLTDEQWTYYMEVYIHDATEGTSYAPQVDGFSVSTEPVSEVLEINDLTFTKYTYARFEPYYNDYELVTDYVTVINDNSVLFRCYYVAEEEFLPEDLLPDLDAKFLPIISEIQTGNATEGIREIANIVNDGLSVEGISRVVSISELAAKNYILTPSAYLSISENAYSYLSIEEITRDMARLENELEATNSALSKALAAICE